MSYEVHKAFKARAEQCPNFMHSLRDDIESLFYVLIYCAAAWSDHEAVVEYDSCSTMTALLGSFFPHFVTKRCFLDHAMSFIDWLSAFRMDSVITNWFIDAHAVIRFVNGIKLFQDSDEQHLTMFAEMEAKFGKSPAVETQAAVDGVLEERHGDGYYWEQDSRLAYFYYLIVKLCEDKSEHLSGILRTDKFIESSSGPLPTQAADSCNTSRWKSASAISTKKRSRVAEINAEINNGAGSSKRAKN